MKVHQIFWKELKSNMKSILFFTVLMMLFFFWFVSIFDPELFAGMEEYFELYPEAILDMIGGQFALAEFGGFIHTYLFSMAWFYFGIYFIMKVSQDIPKEIEDKTVDIILSKPIKRWEFTIGKYLQYIASAAILILGVTGALLIGIYVLPNVTPEEVYFAELFTALLWLFIFLVALISTGLFFSTFMQARKALVFTFGIVIFLYITGQFYGQFGEDAENIKYISIFYYFNPGDLMIDQIWDDVALHMTVLLVYSAVMTTTSVIIFNKRDIPV